MIKGGSDVYKEGLFIFIIHRVLINAWFIIAAEIDDKIKQRMTQFKSEPHI